jgi:hypothetical protein
LVDDNYGRPPKIADKPQTHRVFKSGFAQPPQMWSTHPANADREENAKRTYLDAPHDARSAWLLFDNVEDVKKQVVAKLYANAKAEPAAPEQTLNALDEYYSLLQLDPRYRGVYLGRAVTRYAELPNELYDNYATITDARAALAKLYPQQLAADLAQLRELAEEHGTLQALRDKVYEATGGRIVFRGREIGRRDLPDAIRRVEEERETVRARILAHDRECRAAHVAAAAAVGQGWKEYLISLIGLLHYAEHTLADLRDAQGMLNNVYAVVTADGKVSSSELKRLIWACNVVHEVLERLHGQKTNVVLDESLKKKLDGKSWEQALEEFKLPPASNNNINEWIRVIDGWINSAAAALAELSSAALERLLATENDIGKWVNDPSAAPSAPVAIVIPEKYVALKPGQERKRQQRLDLWDRFQTADGLFPAIGRVLIAGAIVGAVLGFGSFTGSYSALSIYNGLGRAVAVHVGGEKIYVDPFSAAHTEIPMGQAITIETLTVDGQLIERFQPPRGDVARHFIYNIAGASPMVEWTASYGSAAEQPPRFLGAPNWFSSSVDFYFTQPPESVQTKGGSATRTVLAGAGKRDPDEVLQILSEDKERAQVIRAHAAWDGDNAPNAERWKALEAQVRGTQN